MDSSRLIFSVSKDLGIGEYAFFYNHPYTWCIPRSLLVKMRYKHDFMPVSCVLHKPIHTILFKKKMLRDDGLESAVLTGIVRFDKLCPFRRYDQH